MMDQTNPKHRLVAVAAVALAASLALTGCSRLTPVAVQGGGAPVTPSAVVPAAEETPEPVVPALPLAQQQAIKKAQEYLQYQSFSRKGLIEQLKFEGFEEADAKFAVDSLDVDWNAQAAAKAKEYLDYQSFSRKGLIEQLEFEGFNHDQAVFGAEAVGY